MMMVNCAAELVVAHTSSGAEVSAKKVSGAYVVLAFNTVSSEVLFDVFEARGNANRPSLVYCGDHKSGKRVAATFDPRCGLRSHRCWSSRVARYVEPFALLIGQLA